jgi:sodium-dependent dicarboxylate transporter 2/3/5
VTSDALTEPVEQLSEMEIRFERVRRVAGLVFAPAAFAAVLFWRPETLTPQAHALAAIMAAVVVLWLSEALPMPVTALLGASGCVLMGVAPAKDVFSPFADPLMFLFIGSFILARAIFLHGLDRRLAFGVLSLDVIGARPGRILFAFGAVTAFTSAWISNTATTAMMFTIGMSIMSFLFRHEGAGAERIDRRYATGLMLMTSFAASIGGLATPIGTPPNLIGLGYIRDLLHVDITFFQWSLIGAPVVVILFLFMFVYLNFFCSARVRELTGSHAMLAEEKAKLGPWTTAQKSTIFAFGVTVLMWVVPGIVGLVLGSDDPNYKFLSGRMPEAVAALIGAGLLFLLPGNQDGKAITWKEAAEIDWGVVLLYGGGFALGVLANNTGLAKAVGEGLTSQLPVNSELVMLIAATLVATLVSEATSNTASANIVIPVVIAMAKGAGIDPLEPALGAAFGCSLGFMLPISTPCNAIVYGSGFIPITRMVRYGALLDIAGVVVIVVLVRLLLPLLGLYT